MKLGFREQEIFIDTKNYGRIKAEVSLKNKVGNGYLVTTTADNKIITGYLDLDFNEIIEFDEQRLADLFFTDKYMDMCFAFRVPDSDDFEYCHVKKINNKDIKLVFKTGLYDEKPSAIRRTESSFYWLIENLGDKKEYAVYDIKSASIITSYFDSIEFIDSKDSKYHSIFYQKYIYSNIQDTETNEMDRIDHTVLCGFLAHDGSFSSQILDQEKELLFDPRQMGDNTKSIEFSNFINSVTNKYVREYMEKDSRIDEYTNYLFNNPTLYNNSNKRLAKVYSFTNRKKV